MKLRLICVGKLAEAWQRQAADEYAGRLQRYFPLEIVELKEEKGGRKGDVSGLLKREGDRILEKVPPQSFLLVLDERGRQFGSEQLAEKLGDEMLHGGRDWCLVIGGPYGLDPRLRQRADQLLSLSKMTFTHQMARIFLLEQLYRSSTILRNEPYHNR
ncbi:23S rRNA (pseudouridine1915-N3)-methyltransferase [Malonomonas rubra DSM 5091]|uniref:Ribosomal RNA large subunit methyltransferase H n=1 Tax=Malonomonas rubra DSM 5091 TaxID=1122189 RepID=A0A1M6GJQ0_MALRU|nr:23S rRNA (pseudouridine(1915)-N(3))-methyltransferase RlmH [Malonomonas rubra]SHJ10167.1 23S rRNA (pseudouridine1915-N3)-methyltransferase [Malonomonas rubra DSM 5091]